MNFVRLGFALLTSNLHNCNACVMACDEIKKCYILGNAGRGFSTRIAPIMNTPLIKTHCDGCEECINVCPTAG